MKYLFSHDGRPALKRLSMDKVLIALDFDGTLAPIVQQPPNARMPVSIAHELDRLCSIAPVAIISGRKLSDLKQRVSAKASYLIGNHGNEGLAAIPVDADACQRICENWIKQLRYMPALHAAGIVVEPKGYTLAVHFRLASDHHAAYESLSAAFEKLVPQPRVMPGKCVFDLMPPGAVGKHDAIETLAHLIKPESVLYAGDDACDEQVFIHANPDWITVRVGYWRHSAAKYYLRYQREVRDLLLLLNLQLGLSTSGEQR